MNNKINPNDEEFWWDDSPEYEGEKYDPEEEGS
jgi:hypothetical protein